MRSGKERNFKKKRLFQFSHLYVATFQRHIQMEYTCIYIYWSGIPEFVVPFSILLDRWLLMGKKKSMKIPNEHPESVNRRTDNIKPKVNGQKGKQWPTKHYIDNWRLSNMNRTKNRGKLMCSGTVSRSCSTSDTSRVTHATNPAISHEWWEDRIAITISVGIYDTDIP